MMKSLLISLILTLLPHLHAQIAYNAKTGQSLCVQPGTHFCASGSLQGSSFISCTPQGTAEIRSCHFELAGILPPGYEGAAVCYESSSHAGDALCAFNGTGYTPFGLEVNIPETVLCDDTPLDHLIADGTSTSTGTDNSIEVVEVQKGPFQLEISRRDGSAGPSSLIPNAVLNSSSIALSTTTTTALPLPTQPLAFGSGKRALGQSSTCSNPWSREDFNTDTADVLTLNIVLVIPTPEPAPEPQSTVSETEMQTSITTSTVPETGSLVPGSSLSLIPLVSTGAGSVSGPDQDQDHGHSSTVPILTPYASTSPTLGSITVTSSEIISVPHPYGTGVFQTGLANGAVRAHFPTGVLVVIPVVLVVVMWFC